MKNKQICPLEIAHPKGPSFLNYGNTTYYSVPHVLDVHVSCNIQGQSLNTIQQIDGIGSFQAHTGCITHVTESAQVRPIHIAEIHDLASDSIFGVLKQFDFSAVTYPPEPNLNTTTQKPITILDATNFSDGLKIIFDIEATSTDVIRVFLVIFVFLAIFLTIYGCSKTFRLWFNDCCSFTKPTKFWSRKYDNVPHFIKARARKTNSHIHERMQHIFSAIRKPLRKDVVKEQPTSSETYNNDEDIRTIFQTQRLYPVPID